MIILPIFNTSLDCKTAAVFCLKIGFTVREAPEWYFRAKRVGVTSPEGVSVARKIFFPFPPSLQTFPLTARARVLKPMQKYGLFCSFIPIAICEILSWFNYDSDSIRNHNEAFTNLRQVLQGHLNSPPPHPPPVWIGLLTESRIMSMLIFYY